MLPLVQSALNFTSLLTLFLESLFPKGISHSFRSLCIYCALGTLLPKSKGSGFTLCYYTELSEDGISVS